MKLLVQILAFVLYVLPEDSTRGLRAQSCLAQLLRMVPKNDCHSQPGLRTVPFLCIQHHGVACWRTTLKHDFTDFFVAYFVSFQSQAAL